jgi:hypothetical protein
LSNENVTLNLSGLPAHTQIQVLFDLYLIRSWDGNQLYLSSGEAIGPDRWMMKFDGVEQLTTTFTNWTSLGYRQSFPNLYPYGDFPAKFASSESNTLGYIMNGSPMDSVYAMSYTKPHTSDTFSLDLSAFGLQVKTDESWGVDNVCVYLAYSQPLLSNILYIPMAIK